MQWGKVVITNQTYIGYYACLFLLFPITRRSGVGTNSLRGQFRPQSVGLHITMAWVHGRVQTDVFAWRYCTAIVCISIGIHACVGTHSCHTAMLNRWPAVGLTLLQTQHWNSANSCLYTMYIEFSAWPVHVCIYACYSGSVEYRHPRLCIPFHIVIQGVKDHNCDKLVIKRDKTA